MPPLSCARHQFPPAVIRHASWLSLRFTQSYRDVEELLAERSVDVSYETARRWVLKFGPTIARNLRRLRPKPSPRAAVGEIGSTARHEQGRRRERKLPRFKSPESGQRSVSRHAATYNTFLQRHLISRCTLRTVRAGQSQLASRGRYSDPCQELGDQCGPAQLP